MNKEHFIHAYTRLDAIAGGVLIDATSLAREAGFRYPLALTRAVWDNCVRVPASNTWQDEVGRLWDILMVLLAAFRAGGGGDGVYFTVRVLGDDNRSKEIRLKAICGPGDTAEPVLTILLPEED